MDLDHEMTALSGGQAARAGLASLLLSRYDVFLLDEPTNDLDLDGLARLESFVAGLRAGTVLVSHDREFLTRTVTRVVELDLAQQQVRRPTAAATRPTWRSARWPAGTRARSTTSTPTRGRAWRNAPGRSAPGWRRASRTRAARRRTTTRSAGKFRTEATEKQAAKARQTERLIERLDVVEEPRKEWDLRMEIAVAPRAGAIVASLRGAVVRRGEFTLGPVDLQIDWADRVAITGANGSGKTTLLAARCSAGYRSTRGTPRWAPASWSARSTRPAACSSGTSR